MSEDKLFMTQRRAMIEAYKVAGQPFSASTKPYKSTVSWQWNSAANSTISSVGWLIARTGQTCGWFSYKIGDAVPGNVTQYRPATEADTNVSKARTTNGAEDFVIEGMSASNRSIRCDSFLGAGAAFFAVADADVANAMLGLAPIIDPAALFNPPQVQSPFNLENMLYRAIAGHIAVEFEWDRSKVVKMGTLEQLPEGAANSYLRASGEPSTNDRYRVPEGYLWRREGQPDSEFIVRGTLTEPVCAPYIMVIQPNNTTVAGAVQPLTRLWLDSVVRLHGLSVKLPSRN
jgi:hypothetical protein